MLCDSCNRGVPTKRATLYQNIGMLVVHQERKLKGNFCKGCLTSYFWQYTYVTSVLGWWGLVSLLVAPVALAVNLFHFLMSRRLTVHYNTLPSETLPSTARPFGLCPHCYSQQTAAMKLGKSVYASVIGSVMLFLWGIFLVVSFWQQPLDQRNLFLGYAFTIIAMLSIIGLIMTLRTRMLVCQQCDARWPPQD